ncbi:SGNH/GDSL hydrolase family protein [Streptomyces barringtoniae]|uniref:SGNH/GDSL hydrolase family protein n=1 Tax=Streptomyces barringtoniae TaxID=2892029 RepID=UPI001E36CD79|nr:SGNH/GDSL hydrolase family protein [Streptomyces barringtoniae]MCC5476067.1 SGNH/GDSL hydrolase family protein [Streptomyces barringtoniae]
MAALAACAALTGGLLQAAPAAAAPRPGHGQEHGTPVPPAPPTGIAHPDGKLGKGWKSSGDRAVTAAADTGGLKILVADSGKAYAWKTAAELSEPGMTADSWIGNQCVMDRDHVAAVYAPRTFTNKPDLMQGGAFAAIVDTATGHVTKLPFTVSLAYFDPSCNTRTRTAAFTAFRDVNDPALTKTRVVTVDTVGKSLGRAALKGEITGAVPVEDGTVAARGHNLVHIDRAGTVKDLATGDSVPFDIRPAQDGKIAFVDRKDTKTAQAKVWSGHGRPALVATGKLGDLDLMPGEAGRVFLTGHPQGSAKVRDTGITRLNAPADTDISTRGRLAVEPVLTPGIRAGLAHIKSAGKGFTRNEPTPHDTRPTPETVAGDQPVTVTSTATATGEKVTQSVADTTAPSGKNPSPALPITGGRGKGSSVARVNDPTTAVDPRDTDRICAISRNDVNAQALQPTPNQVEWAVDMAVRGQLRSQYLRQGGYRSQSGLGTIDPQGLFSVPKLAGGDGKGRIPANVLLGIMAQESNLWQAEGGSVPGQMGNPLAAMDGYYGRKAVENDPDAYWKIHWDKSDCGYGVGQVTDGMRLAGHEKTDANGHKEKALDPGLQKAIAVDYATNIAAAMQILADKWNEVHSAGQTVTVNNDDPAMVENWFTAVWNYNLGFNPAADAGKNAGHWGLGWYNNPANPLYKKSWGHPFMDTDVDGPTANKDAAHPQDWPYEEKVMGWAAWSMDTGFSYGTDGKQDWPGDSGYNTAGFQPAWWTSKDYRSHVSPPLDTFCNTKNNCDPNVPPNCPNIDCYKQYWWNQPNVTWKDDCKLTCGHENIKYQTLISEPGQGHRLQDGTPICTGAPSGAKVVASVPDGTPTWSDCGNTRSAGTFGFRFFPDSDGHYEGKEDLHQVGGGYGGHYWYAHTRNADHLGGDGGPMAINGVWTLGQNLGWARILVHLPDTGAQTRQAKYHVINTDSTSPERSVQQRAGRWVSLGAFHFTGRPAVMLSNVTDDGTADEDIAWGSVAFQPLPGKPKNVVVAMGDSYSSGEGASEGDRDYYPETNYRSKLDDNARNACHRSTQAWSRQATMPGASQSIGRLDDSLDPSMDYHLIACSGARTYNVLPKKVDDSALSKGESQNGEEPQLDKGYLDQNTTLVTISIGGNDSRFSQIIQKCLLSVGNGSCKGETFDKTDDSVNGRDEQFRGQPLETAVPGLMNQVVRPDITRVLREIHKRAQNAKIVLMGYPPLISDKGSCLNIGFSGMAIGLSEASAAWLDDTADTLAAAMQGAADDAKASGINVWFSNPKSDFAGKGVCGDPEQVHGIVKTLVKSDEPIKDWPLINQYGLSAQSFHPKIGGARLYANALERTMAGMSL